LPERRHFLAGTGAVLAGVALSAEGPHYGREWLTNIMRSAPAGDAPNVLLVVLDTVRAKSLSLYGYLRDTSPNLERLAQSGVRFDRAIATAPWTLPTHASMFTGRYPYEMGFDWLHPMPSEPLTLAEALTAEGYATAGFVANLTFCTREFGLDRGFMRYEAGTVDAEAIMTAPQVGHLLGRNEALRARLTGGDQPARKRGDAVTRSFLDWQARQGQRPFFAFLNYFDAHDPYLPPEEFAVRYAGKRPIGNFDYLKAEELSPEEIQQLSDAYDGAIAFLDYQLGVLLRELEQRSVLDRTVVVVTSDHGEQFGEHGLMSHLNSLYLPLLHVPLVVSMPGRTPAGTRVVAPVSLRDLPSTVMDLAGLGHRARFPGESLARRWSSPGGRREEASEPILAEIQQAWGQPASAPAMKGPMKSVLAWPWHYIKNLGTQEEELYDLSTDGEEERNLIGTVQARPLIDRLRAEMDALLAPKRGLA
jgi:arylsulfatase A-like enzyme